MSVASSESDGGSLSRTRRQSCGIDENSEAIDLLAIWILEDIDAVAKSFGLEATGILKAVLDRVQSEAPFFAQRNVKAES